MNKPSPSRVKTKSRSHSDDYNDRSNSGKSSGQKERQRKLTVTNADMADEVRSRSVASIVVSSMKEKPNAAG